MGYFRDRENPARFWSGMKSKFGYSGKCQYPAVNRWGRKRERERKEGSEITNKTHEIVTLLPSRASNKDCLFMEWKQQGEHTATWKTTSILADVVPVKLHSTHPSFPSFLSFPFFFQ